ncbi:MAG: aminotransferase class I/II-fold pyridoxal phosphate-dependent enzyme, partial [Polyangiales bacterium]
MTFPWVVEELARLEGAGLLRARSVPWQTGGPRLIDGAGRSFLNLASNDYLSLAAVGPTEVARGSGASPLVTGRSGRHAELERALATWLGHEECTLFPSGFAGNLAVLAALSGPDTVVVSDALNHASIVDGCRLSHARVVIARHLAADDVDRALRTAPEHRRIVVTDAYFSMDAD